MLLLEFDLLQAQATTMSDSTPTRRETFTSASKRSFHEFSSEDDSSESISSNTSASTLTQQPSSQRLVTDLDRLVNQEMSKMSLEQRSRVFEDVHAVSQDREEDSNVAAESLAKLSDLLQKRGVDKQAYDKANFLCPSYVGSQEFLLPFLRSEHYVLRKTKNKIYTYFKIKRELFGDDQLGRAITFNDLTSSEQKLLRNGAGICHPNQKDIGGRLFGVYMLNRAERAESILSMKRIMWYAMEWMCSLSSPADQLKGFVHVLYAVGSNLSPQLLDGYVSLTKAMPMRLCGIHFCGHDTGETKEVTSYLQLNLNQSCRLRFRSHYGNYPACMYSIHGYGLQLPVIDHDEIHLEDFTNHLSNKLHNEVVAASQHESDNKKIPYPRKFDVLLGRGIPYQRYTGNARLQVFVDMYKERYFGSNVYGAKLIVCTEILKSIKESSGRFLRRSSDGVYWECITDDMAKDKIGHAFRSTLSAETSAKSKFAPKAKTKEKTKTKANPKTKVTTKTKSETKAQAKGSATEKAKSAKPSQPARIEVATAVTGAAARVLADPVASTQVELFPGNAIEGPSALELGDLPLLAFDDMRAGTEKEISEQDTSMMVLKK